MLTKDTAVVYIWKGEYGVWAEATIREWENGGSFSCQSDYGNFSYTWTSIGCSTLREFLCGLDKQYFMKKTTNNHHMELSLEDTVKLLKSDVIAARRNGTIIAEIARECWDEIDELSMESVDNEVDYYRAVRDYCPRLLIEYSCMGVGDSEYPPYVKDYKLECTQFWDKIWPNFVECWKEELASVPPKPSKAEPEDEGYDFGWELWV